MPYYRLPSFDFKTNNLYSIRKEDQEFESYEPSTLAVTDKVRFKTFAKLISHNFHHKYLSTIFLVLLMSIFFIVMAASIYCLSFNPVGFLSNAIMTDDRNEFQIYQTVRINEENYEILRGPELYKKTLDAAENSLQKNIIKTKEYNFGGQTLKAYFYSSEDDEVLVYEGSSLDSVDLYGRTFQTKICDKLPSGTIGISTKVLASLENDAEYLSMDIENFSFYHADPGTIGFIDTYAYSQDSLADDRLLVGRKPNKSSEIVLSQGIVERMFGIYPNNEFNDEQLQIILNTFKLNNLKSNYLNQIYDGYLNLSHFVGRVIDVVGITKDSDNSIVMFDPAFKAIRQEYFKDYYYDNIWIKREGVEPKILAKFFIKSGLSIDIEQFQTVNYIKSFFKKIRTALIWSTVVSGILGACLILVIASQNSNSRIKRESILRNFGVKRSQRFLLRSVEFVFCSVISVLFLSGLFIAFMITVINYANQFDEFKALFYFGTSELFIVLSAYIFLALVIYSIQFFRDQRISII